MDFSDTLNDYLGKWGAIYIEGSFDTLEGGESPEITLLLGTQTITFERLVPPPPEIGLEKEGVYDPNTNTITWTVGVTPPDGVPLSGYQLVDSYSGNQTYVADSFYVGGIQIEDTDLDFDTHQVIYTFPDPTSGDQVITYKTAPNTFGAETGADEDAEQSRFTNEASIVLDGEPIKGPVQYPVEVDWISKTGELEDAEAYIMKWIIDVHLPEGAAIKDVAVKDTISTEHALTTTPYQPQYTIGTAEAQNMAAGSDEGEYEVSEQEITFHLPDLDASARIVYYTKINASVAETLLNTNETITFSNDAELTWDLLPAGLSTAPGDTASVNVVGSGGLLSKSAGSPVGYGPGKDVIHWTITVNRNKIPITGAAINDTLPEGQELLLSEDYPFVVKLGGVEHFKSTSPTEGTGLGNLGSGDGFARNFLYTFEEATISSTYTIEYYSKIIVVPQDDPEDDIKGLDLLYVNGDVSFYNDATLSRTSAGGAVSIKGEQQYNSQMLSKSLARDYDCSDRSIQWKLVINRNRLPLTDANISDTLPAGMELLIGDSYPFTVTNDITEASLPDALTVGEDGNTSFEVELPSPTSDQYTITFYTKVTDEGLIDQTQGDKLYTNTAYLNADEVTDLSHSAQVTVKNPVITKEYTYEIGSDAIEWSVGINAGQVNLQSAVVADTLNAGLMLDSESVQLYAVEVESDGSVADASSDTLVDRDDYGIILPTVENSNTFTVELPDGPQAYRLEFTTFVVADNLNDINQISLSGSAGNPSGTANADRIIINNLWSGGGSGSRTLTVVKDDGAGNPVAGATYRLLNFNKEPVRRGENYIDAVTNDEGIAEFANLAEWIFYVVEVSPPDGYLLNPEHVGGERLSTDLTFETSDAPALGVLSFAKESTEGTPLTGGEFTLTGTDYKDDPIERTAASENGVVTFTDLPLGSYTVQESIAPQGYVESSELITATVAYNSDKTDVVVTITSSNDKLVNRPLPLGAIMIHKTDGANPLADAEFTLYDSSGQAYKTADSQHDGTVTFEDIPEGTYTLRETRAPIGFAVSDAVLTAVVSYNTDRTDTLVNVTPTDTVVNAPLPPAIIELLKTNGFNTLAGAMFELYDADDNFMQSAVSGSDGLVRFTDVEVGTYTIREITAPAYHIKSDAVITAVVGYNAQNTGTAVALTPDGPVINEVDPSLAGTIELLKTDDAGALLAGARFALYDGTGSAVMEAVSGADGKIVFAGVPLGSYTIREIDPPVGHISSDMTANAEITLDHAGTTVMAEPYTFVNARIGAVVHIQKVDASTEEPLFGAEFTLSNEDGSVQLIAQSDEDGIAMFTGIMPGTYTIEETKAPEGYVADDETITVFAELDELYTFIVKNSAMEELPQSGGGKLPQSGSLLDGNVLFILGALLVIAGIVLVQVRKRRRKRSKA
ncbi:MAG: SpaA isopeptide-forming pilin-related protein [Christensenellales bacterium]